MADYESDINQIESREEDFLRNQEELCNRIKDSMDKLNDGHPAPDDKQYEDWNNAEGVKNNFGKLTLSEAGQAGIDAYKSKGLITHTGPVDSENVKGIFEHSKNAYEYGKEWNEFRKYSGEIKEEWAESMKANIDSIRTEIKDMEPEREKIVNDASDLKREVISDRDELLHDRERQEEMQELDNYGWRLDKIINAMNNRPE